MEEEPEPDISTEHNLRLRKTNMYFFWWVGIEATLNELMSLIPSAGQAERPLYQNILQRWLGTYTALCYPLVISNTMTTVWPASGRNLRL